MRIYNPSGYLYDASSYYLGPQAYKNIVSGIPAVSPIIWYTAPPKVASSSNLTTVAITASGLRANMFVAPPYPCKLKGVAVRITAALAGIPTASGIFGLYTNAEVSNDTVNERFFAPASKIWQSEPFVCSNTGIYIRYPDVPLEPLNAYWLTWLGTRNSTTYQNSAGIGIDIYGQAALGGTTSTLGLNVTSIYSATSNVTETLPSAYPTVPLNLTSTSPIIFYYLGQ